MRITLLKVPSDEQPTSKQTSVTLSRHDAAARVAQVLRRLTPRRNGVCRERMTVSTVCIVPSTRKGIRLSNLLTRAGLKARGIPASASVRRALIAAVAGLAALPAVASAGAPEEILGRATYPGMTTYSCRMGPLPIVPGQNLNELAPTKTCPNAEVVSGPGDIDVFATGSEAEGYVTRFKPSMVEILPGGGEKTPSVWDLHLHHVVWLKNPGGPTFASGEEKTHVKLPQGYGIRADGDENWLVNHMIHNLTAVGNRQVYLTWEIDWVPVEAEADIAEASIRWLDVAGQPQAYPVFDAERGFDRDGDGRWTFPDDVPANPGTPGYEERQKISNNAQWTVPSGGRTLVFAAGHLHPGGTSVDLKVTRDGETVPLFKSGARYYEPAGAVSWDVSMRATRPEWRVSLKAGDTVSISATYKVRRASWYESMGIMPLAVTQANDPAARDPFDDAEEVSAMYEQGGILTHGRLPENIDAKAGKNLRLPDPRKLKSRGRVPKAGLEIDGFGYSLGGYSASRGFPQLLMRPPLIRPGRRVGFTNLEAQFGMPDDVQAWHSITSCRAPCNRGPGIGYPLAAGPIKFDSGQLGYGTGLSQEVTTGSNEYTTPPLRKAGKTYTYFCRIHPFMRGSVRVKAKPKRRNH
jgi:plastocyanin